MFYDTKFLRVCGICLYTGCEVEGRILSEGPKQSLQDNDFNHKWRFRQNGTPRPIRPKDNQSLESLETFEKSLPKANT